MQSTTTTTFKESFTFLLFYYKYKLNTFTLDGFYECNCNTGFKGDGKSCELNQSTEITTITATTIIMSPMTVEDTTQIITTSMTTTTFTTTATAKNTTTQLTTTVTTTLKHGVLNGQTFLKGG